MAGVGIISYNECPVPQVAGVSFAFDPSQPAGRRVCGRVVKLGDEYLRPAQRYRLAVKQYLRGGNDGYGLLRDCRLLLPDDMCPEIGLAIQNHFAAIDVRAGRARPSKHRQSLVTLSRRWVAPRLTHTHTHTRTDPPPCPQTQPGEDAGGRRAERAAAAAPRQLRRRARPPRPAQVTQRD